MKKRNEIIEKVRTMPALPPASVDLIRLFQDPEVSVDAIRRAVEYDPCLTSNVLRLANSAYFGAVAEIGSIKEAVVRLGLKRIFQLVMASVIAPLAQQPIRGYAYAPGELLRHSMATAVATDELAAALHVTASGHAFTAGLLHDLGKVVLGTFLEVDAEPILALAFDKQYSFELAEEEVLGLNHAEVGAVLLESWHIPADIVAVVRWHHEPEECAGDRQAAALVHVADNLSRVGGWGIGRDGLNYSLSKYAVEQLRVNTMIVEQVLDRVKGDMEELADLYLADTEKAER